MLFRIEKKGLIYAPEKVSSWMQHTLITPTPVLISPEVIRVYAGFMDCFGVSRLGFLDLDANDPKRILNISKDPILPLGQPGCFDDNGMILGEIIQTSADVLRLYYVGFQIPQKVKFLAFSGVAESRADGVFEKVLSAPILDRSSRGPYIRAIHSVLKENEVYRVWYSVGDGWEVIHGKPYPKYHICYTESRDGLCFADAKDEPCILPGVGEYRIGRPRVFKYLNKYHMLFTYDTLQKQYHVGYAWSEDGISWCRNDSLFPLVRSETGWDSEMACYPVPLFYRDKAYLFYSGNGMGRSGLGYAELSSEGL